MVVYFAVRSHSTMRSSLILNVPWRGTANSEDWGFSGDEDRMLRASLDQLSEFTTDSKDQWRAAIVLYFPRTGGGPTSGGAWTIEGAMRLAEVLPEELTDFRDALLNCFAARFAGALGDAHTKPSPRKLPTTGS